MWTGSVWTVVASFCRVTPIDSRYGPRAWLLDGFSGNGVNARLPKYVKRHVNGTYTRRNKEKKRSYSRYMRKKKRLQPIKIWHILGQNDKILSQTKKILRNFDGQK